MGAGRGTSPWGPVENVAGLRIEAPGGKLVGWRRDETEPYRFECDVPADANAITVRLDTICNEPAVLDLGYLSYGNKSVGIINWGTCLLYPEGFTGDAIQVSLSVRLPSGWQYATALETAQHKGSLARFRTLSLTELVDRPLIAGEHFRTIALDSGGTPPAFLDLVSESQNALKIGSNVVELFGRVAKQANAMLGTCHYSEFHFLVTCSDEFGRYGLKHRTSSVNGVGERDLIGDAGRSYWIANLLVHEYVHSWCGKFRRPVGMCTPDFQTPQKTRLLWVYEGLAES